MSAVRLTEFVPQLTHYSIEQQSHPLPWSEKNFCSCQGSQYRNRLLSIADEAIGFSICQQVFDEITLMNIAVLPNFRGQGWGAYLLRDVIDYSKHKRLTLWLEVRASNHVAINLYRQYGFCEVGRRPNYYPCENKGHEDALVMRWQHAD